MKNTYIKDILTKPVQGKKIEIFGWIASKRKSSKICFLDLVDSTGKIQVTIPHESEYYSKVKDIKPESSVKITGIIRLNNSKVELEMKELEMIGPVSIDISPKPRSNSHVFEKKHLDSFLSNRHLYIRNEKVMSVLKFRYILIEIIRKWFRTNNFIEVAAPILTQVALYDDESSAFNLDFFGKKVFLTQCAAFHLESAVHAFEKVFFINPSFRAEKSKSKRHLAEYWHIKGEIAFADFEDIIQFVEKMFEYIITRIQIEAEEELNTLKINLDSKKLKKVPYARITYKEALERLKKSGVEKKYGKSLSERDEAVLGREFDSLFWITHMPCNIEPFPYVKSDDSRVTKTADLIAPDGFGELLGVAEKIWKPEELLKNMKDHDKNNDRYRWYLELRQIGSIPHSGFGVGLERLIRWFLKLDHVRDAIPFPRMFGRNPNP